MSVTTQEPGPRWPLEPTEYLTEDHCDAIKCHDCQTQHEDTEAAGSLSAAEHVTH